MTLRISSCGFFWPLVWSSAGGKLPSCSVVLKRSALAVVLPALISACAPIYADDSAKPIENPEKSLISDSAATEAAGNSVFSFWPWENGEESKPPAVKHYKIPTMSGDGLDFKAKPPALIKAPRIDADAVYQYVILKKKNHYRYWIRLNSSIDHFKLPIDTWMIKAYEK